MKLLFFVTLVAEKIKRKQVQNKILEKLIVMYSCVCVCVPVITTEAAAFHLLPTWRKFKRDASEGNV